MSVRGLSACARDPIAEASVFDGSFVCPCVASLRAGVRGEVFPLGGTALGDGRIPRRVGRVRRCPGSGEALSLYGPGACEKCGEYRVGLLQTERQAARQPCWPCQPEKKILI